MKIWPKDLQRISNGLFLIRQTHVSNLRSACEKNSIADINERHQELTEHDRLYNDFEEWRKTAVVGNTIEISVTQNLK